MTEEDMKKMKLHDSKNIISGMYVLKVMNGWIYYNQIGVSITSTFVPESKEIK